jgi:hypothetical protein
MPAGLMGHHHDRNLQHIAVPNRGGDARDHAHVFDATEVVRIGDDDAVARRLRNGLKLPRWLSIAITENASAESRSQSARTRVAITTCKPQSRVACAIGKKYETKTGLR